MDDFDKQFKKTQNMATAGFVVNSIVTVAGLAFAGWVVVKVMQHFGIV